MQKLLLIDGGMLLWKTVPNKVLTETKLMYTNPEKSLEETYNLIDWYITEKIFKVVQPDYFIGFVDGSRDNNFRTKVSESYKSNRVGKELPRYFKEAKQYLIDKWKFSIPEGIEVDDALLITENRLKSEYEVIIVCQDKDIIFTEGRRYNPVKEEYHTTIKFVEDKVFWGSLIIGDQADNIEGLKGLGPAHWKKISEDPNIDRSFPELVFREYLRYYKWNETLALENFYKNYRLLKILREKEDFIIPEIQTINKEVKPIDTNDLVF